MSLQVSVNLSATDFARPGLTDQVLTALDRSGLDPSGLCIEMTESAVIARPEETVQALRRLRAAGITLALDDFGTGYSSLAYLRNLPVDILKIDRSFVSGLGTTRTDEATIEAIIALSRAFDVKVVAEGVESASQLDTLNSLGAEYAQGFFFSRPRPPQRIPGLLDAMASDCLSG